MSNIDDYEIICKIGKGAFSTVYKVKSKKDKKIYAIKKVDFKKSTEKEKDNSFNEVNLLKKINSPNVIGFVDSFYDQSNNFLYLVMEYASYGDLDLQIQNRIKTRKYYDEDELLSMMEQIAIGLKDIHSKNILHRDLKAANIFVCDPNNKLLKIGDFNVSKVINPFSLKNTQTGTPYYASPEVWNNMPYDFKSDIWSVGCLFYEMTSLTAPFKGKSMKELYNNIEKGFFNPLPKRYSKNLFNIISICLRQDDKERPTAEELLEYIRKIRNPPKPLEIKKEEPKPKYLPKIVNEGNFDPIINHYKSIKRQSSDPKRLKSASKPKALQPLYTEHNIPTPKNDDKNLKRNQSYLIGSNKRILHTVSPKKTPIDLDIKVNYHYLKNGTFDENKNKEPSTIKKPKMEIKTNEEEEIILHPKVVLLEKEKSLKEEQIRMEPIRVESYEVQSIRPEQIKEERIKEERIKEMPLKEIPLKQVPLKKESLKQVPLKKEPINHVPIKEFEIITRPLRVSQSQIIPGLRCYNTPKKTPIVDKPSMSLKKPNEDPSKLKVLNKISNMRKKVDSETNTDQLIIPSAPKIEIRNSFDHLQIQNIIDENVMSYHYPQIPSSNMNIYPNYEMHNSPYRAIRYTPSMPNIYNNPYEDKVLEKEEIKEEIPFPKLTKENDIPLDEKQKEIENKKDEIQKEFEKLYRMNINNHPKINYSPLKFDRVRSSIPSKLRINTNNSDSIKNIISPYSNETEKNTEKYKEKEKNDSKDYSPYSLFRKSKNDSSQMYNLLHYKYAPYNNISRRSSNKDQRLNTEQNRQRKINLKELPKDKLESLKKKFEIKTPIRESNGAIKGNTYNYRMNNNIVSQKI